MKILITGVGGPTPASVAVSLKRYSRYSDCSLVGVDANRLATGLYRAELFDKTAVVPPANSPEYWPAIEQLVDQEGIELALVQPEVEVVEWARQARNDRLPCRALLPDYDLAQLLVDKAAMSRALEDTGLVPVSIELDRELANIDQVERVLSYPFWVRASAGSSGLGSLLVDDRDALASWVRINKGVTSFLCSEYLPGRNLAVKLLYFEGEPVRAACAERVNYIMAKVAPSGITGNTAFGRFLNEEGPARIAMQALERLFEVADAPRHGFFTVDLKEDADGTPRITEINVRNVAFNGCFAQLGANFAEDTVRLLTSEPEFDSTYRQYRFDDDYVFIRDVDVEPIVLRQSELLV